VSERTARNRAALEKRYTPRESWYSAFLEALRQFGTVKTACEVAGISRSTAFEARDSLEWFAQHWKEALAEFDDSLRDEVIRRGRDGWLEPVIHNGQYQFQDIARDVMGNPIRVPVMVRKFDSTLLIFEAKARMPETYRDRWSVEMSGEVTHRHEEVSELDRRIDALLGRMEDMDPKGEGSPEVATGGET
jgi:hypothetical protein